ncbi:MAG: carboxymuconolactone decarboxylase family protein [Acidimicrobiaceae bacterium]|nr:carboxymuconolactone decarboxylase family protein [Acidimicrobiaceae bacterium]
MPDGNVLNQPRIAPLPPSARDADVQELLAGAGPYGGNNVFTTMVRHPRLYKRWLPWGTAMLYARLPARDRELLILRTAHRCGSVYEWTQHVEIAAAASISDAEIQHVQAGPSHADWSAFDAALLRAVDELLDEHTISDRTWQTLADRYDESLLIEVPMVVGHYFTMALTFNALGVQPESAKD